MLLHVPHPEVALGEIARVLAPLGELSLTEIDWGSISIECTITARRPPMPTASVSSSASNSSMR